MASYGNTVLTSAGIDLVKRVIANTATFEITKVATSSDSRLTNATISTIEALTAMSSVQQTGKVTAFDTSNSKQVGLKCEFTNQGLTNQYDICGVGIYAKEAGKSEILFAVAPAKEPETMPAKPDDQSALFTFSLNVYMAVGQASAMSITATTEGVVKSINGTIKPDANGNVTLPYYSQAEVDQKVSSLSGRIDSKVSGLQSTVSNMRAGDRNYARDTFNEWKTFTGFTGAGVYYAKHLGSFCPDDLKVGDTVTIGLSIKNSGIQSGTLNIESAGNLTGWDAGAIYNPGHDIAKVCPDGTTTTLIQYYTLTADNLKNNSFDFQIRANDFLSGTLSYKGFFVKKGTLATDWTPAPEDTDQAISKVSQTANAAKAKADDNANSIKALSDETTTAISNLDSKMTRLMPQAAYVPIQIGDKTDLNDLRTCGFYLLQGETINSPVDGWNYVKVQGIPTRLNQFVWQDINPAEQWCRWYDGSKWLPWVKCTKATEPIRLGGYRPKPGAVPF